MCNKVNRIIPSLEPKSECLDVPKEICTKVQVEASKVKRPQIKIWCGPAKPPTDDEDEGEEEDDPVTATGDEDLPDLDRPDDDLGTDPPGDPDLIIDETGDEDLPELDQTDDDLGTEPNDPDLIIDETGDENLPGLDQNDEALNPEPPFDDPIFRSRSRVSGGRSSKMKRF